MKNILSFLVLLISIPIGAQDITTLKTTDWSTMRKSGFYESHTSITSNNPPGGTWYWVINIAHTSNSTNTTKPYYYGGQMAFAVNNHSSYPPDVYVRTTTELGDGIWAKVVHSKGNHTIEGKLTIDELYLKTGKVNELKIGAQGTPNSSGSVERLAIAPFGHTGRWVLSARDIPGIAFLELSYGSSKLLTFNHNKK